MKAKLYNSRHAFISLEKVMTKSCNSCKIKMNLLVTMKNMTEKLMQVAKTVRVMKKHLQPWKQQCRDLRNKTKVVLLNFCY
ncbi:hypothetical protein PR048_004558 [Dryococelus australis]|uniref:Uncharacterized protein n=1 Tax=Dryococelus australis TaxID=614101 RepID=A0ABQ9I5R4_9NEOP|nr:hypothetical protein PR048_004558 [Dryococelus australis]